MHNILVSIIIPIYKVELYIVRCIDSVLRQTYRHLEVILIDDCSPDSSILLAQDHIEQSPLSKDLHFVYLKHDHNRGLSAARNTGINAATGEYVYFLDSDDEITEDCIRILVAKVMKYPNVDIVQGNILITWQQKAWMNFSCNQYPEYTDDPKWIKRSYLNGGLLYAGIIPMTAWNKLFNREFIVKNELWFKEGIYYEDDYWRLMNWKHIHSFAFCKECTYKYYLNEQSITKSNSNTEKKWHSILIISRDYMLTLGKDDIYQVECSIVHLKNILYDDKYGVCDKNKKRIFDSYLKQIISKSHLSIMAKAILMYLLLPNQYIKDVVIGKMLSYCRG